jgi:hypothetical protein
VGRVCQPGAVVHGDRVSVARGFDTVTTATHLLILVRERRVLGACLLGGLRDVELAVARRLLALDPVGEPELPGRRRELGRAQV